MSENIYIIAAARTPIGSFQGQLASISAPDLGATAIRGALQRSGLAAEQWAAVDEVYMGCVLPAGLGQAPARQALKKAGVPDSTSAVTLNKVCGSGMQAIMFARQALLAEEASLIIAGGMESMSNTPYLLKEMRKGARLGNQTAIDAMVHDGLWDPYNNLHMGSCAEQAAQKYGFDQAAQDAFAAESYRRSLASIEAGLFKTEIEPVEVPGRGGQVTIVDTDEEPGRGNIDKLPSLKPAFEKTGSITAGNASTLNDGAAALLIGNQDAVDRLSLTPIARIVATARHAQEPMWFTTAPVEAMRKVLTKANLNVSDIDCFEINEAFAVVTMAAIHDLGLDAAKVNPRGGGVSIGHPIGATGARLLVTLMHTLKAQGGRYGLASLCIGGGEATAIIIEML